jgi:hypothetical protein
MKLLPGLSWFGAVLIGLAVAVSCSRPPRTATAEKPQMDRLVFLTHAGCVQTKIMRVRLDAALKTLGLRPDYQFIDADSLAESDPRGGYGTPTILYDGRDLFEMPEPPVPHPPAT